MINNIIPFQIFKTLRKVFILGKIIYRDGDRKEQSMSEGILPIEFAK